MADDVGEGNWSSTVAKCAPTSRHMGNKVDLHSRRM